MNFIGHKKIINILNKSLALGKVSHAYLFSGPEVVGKFTLAKQFSQAIIDGKKEMNLHSLDEYEKNKLNYSDLILLVPLIEEKKGLTKEREIKSEDMRKNLKELLLYPYSGKKRILIVNNAHRMNKTAQNVILKSLEEPNDTSVLILITHQDSLLLSTIKSRCQKINFSLVPDKEYPKNIIGSASADRIKLLMGRPGNLLKIDDSSGKSIEDESIARKFMEAGKFGTNEKMVLASKLSENTSTAKKIIEKYIWSERMKLLGSVDESSYEKCLANIETVESCMRTLDDTNASAKLTLENAILKLK